MKWSVNLKDKFYDKAELDSKFDALVGFTTLVVNSLPVTGKNGIMYLLPSDESTESNNIYDEYIWVSDKFEKIGSTKTTVDLSGYVTQTEMNTQLANKANTNHTHDISALEDSEDMIGGIYNDINTKADKTTATTSANGLMSKDDKSKLNGIATEANKTVVDSALSSSSANPVQNKVVKGALDGKANVQHNHTFATVVNLQSTLDSKAGTSIATTSANGLMSSSDKTKLDGIATGATKVTVDSSLSSSSTNPVQNKVVNSALNGKANSSHSHSISNITNLQSALDNKSETGHTHDDRYYTETEMNTKLNGKANSSHTHSIGNVTNLQSKLDTIPSLTSTSITVSGTDNQGTITFYKFGKIVVMELDLSKVHLTQTWNAVGTIPKGYMPKLSDGAGAPMTFWHVQGQHGQSAQLNIHESGEIRFAYGDAYGKGDTPPLHTYVTYIVN